MRLGLPSAAVVGDRFGVSDRAVALQLLQVFFYVGLTTSNNSDLVVDENKLRRERAKFRFQALSEAKALPLKGLYFDSRKDFTLIEERVDTKRYTIKAKEEHLCLIEELGSRYITHLSPSFGTAKQISATIIGYFKGITRALSQLLAIGCDDTTFNIGWKSGVIRRLELKLGKPLQWGTIQSGGASVMVWDLCIWRDMGPLICLETTLTGDRYLSILSDHLHSFMSIVHSDGLGQFQQDNATPHASRVATKWLQEHSSDFRHFHLPPKSPEMNIIEDIRDALLHAVEKRSPPPRTPMDFLTALQDSWCEFPP
ncbi:hypothetical protein AVEN_134946-1 [Araneus ventricosus]|uniref:Tc1-like transposase DDE domain-containing protein n=1 Tax=Araneus ventricosus TaxID=182803 RepID=A0A4Y2CII9_ARAVE|nr:hypothetical protein AVEN_134946-1 [Araneus ventricosus]